VIKSGQKEKGIGRRLAIQKMDVLFCRVQCVELNLNSRDNIAESFPLQKLPVRPRKRELGITITRARRAHSIDRRNCVGRRPSVSLFSSAVKDGKKKTKTRYDLLNGTRPHMTFTPPPDIRRIFSVDTPGKVCFGTFNQ